MTVFLPKFMDFLNIGALTCFRKDNSFHNFAFLRVLCLKKCRKSLLLLKNYTVKLCNKQIYLKTILKMLCDFIPCNLDSVIGVLILDNAILLIFGYEIFRL